jgi:hypothetical protein
MDGCINEEPNGLAGCDHFRMEKRQRWFHEGATALRRALERAGRADELPTPGDWYACPSCLGLYAPKAVASGVLTIEDVPPKALGGRPMLLTCKQCNNNAGSELDAHAAMQSVGDSLARGIDTKRWLKATSYANGIPLRGKARIANGGLLFVGIPQQNAPTVAAVFEAAVDAYGSINPGPGLSVTVHTSFDDARARLSLIRAVYLAAFAGLGWTYILRSALSPVREQSLAPDVQIIKPYLFRDPSTPSTRRGILVVSDPPELAAVAVTLGEFTVFLPGLGQDGSWEEVARSYARRTDSGGRLGVRLHGKAVPWPTSPAYFLDA